jgi:hypothetical protein
MYPITYEADLNPTPSRGTTFFRLIVAIPWYIVALFWGLLFYITHFISWIAIIIIGRYPAGLYRFNSGVIRFGARLSGWLTLQTDQWPPFGISDDPSYPIRVQIPPEPMERQSRLKALFRIILVFPVMFVVSYGTGVIAWTAAFVAWLTIVFRGYMPEGINTMLTFCNALNVRMLGYFALLTDDYPPIGPEAARPSGAAPAPAAPVPPPPTPPAV